MVAQDHRFVGAEGVADPLALRGVKDDAGVTVVQADVFVERASVLGERFDGHLQARQSLAVGPVRVRGGDDVRTRSVDSTMDRDGRAVDGPVALDDVAGMVDPDEVALLDQAEVHAERVHPVGVGELRVSGGEVTGDSLVQPGLAEHPEGRRKADLAVHALVLDRREAFGQRHSQLRPAGSSDGLRRRVDVCGVVGSGHDSLLRVSSTSVPYPSRRGDRPQHVQPGGAPRR